MCHGVQCTLYISLQCVCDVLNFTTDYGRLLYLRLLVYEPVYYYSRCWCGLSCRRVLGPPWYRIWVKVPPGSRAVCVGEEFGVPLNFVVESDARSTVAEMDRMPHVRVGWICGLHRCIRKTQTLRLSYRPLTSTLFEILGVLTKSLTACCQDSSGTTQGTFSWRVGQYPPE